MNAVPAFPSATSVILRGNSVTTALRRAAILHASFAAELSCVARPARASDTCCHVSDSYPVKQAHDVRFGSSCVLWLARRRRGLRPGGVRLGRRLLWAVSF